jgi:NitT/TauT family transport system substrate-binding protein
MKIAVPDLITNSYFPVVAAAELGFFEREGLDISVELIAPAGRTYEALRDGEVDFVVAEAHAGLSAFPIGKA